jgi:hypothetical protein
MYIPLSTEKGDLKHKILTKEMEIKKEKEKIQETVCGVRSKRRATATSERQLRWPLHTFPHSIASMF